MFICHTKQSINKKSWNDDDQIRLHAGMSEVLDIELQIEDKMSVVIYKSQHISLSHHYEVHLIFKHVQKHSWIGPWGCCDFAGHSKTRRLSARVQYMSFSRGAGWGECGGGVHIVFRHQWVSVRKVKVLSHVWYVASASWAENTPLLRLGSDMHGWRAILIWRKIATSWCAAAGYISVFCHGLKSQVCVCHHYQ